MYSPLNETPALEVIASDTSSTGNRAQHIRKDRSAMTKTQTL